MKNIRKGFVNVFVAIAILAVVAVAGYYMVIKGKMPTKMSETADWKTYTDSQHGFTFKYSGVNYEPGVIVDITKAPVADGACGSLSPQTLKEDKIFSEANPTGTETNKLRNPLGLHKIYQTASDAHALISIQTCQGIAEGNDTASSFMEAKIFRGNMLVALQSNLDFNGNVKVKDMESVAQKLLDGTYEGLEQDSFNQFVKTISTFKFTK